MIDVIGYWFVFVLALQPFEEWYNCNHPSENNRLHLVCDWDEQDYINYQDIYILRKEVKEDNKIKAYYRNKHYRESIGRPKSNR